MACSFSYKGKQFNSEQEVIDFIEDVKPSPEEERDLRILMKASEEGVTEKDLAEQDHLFNKILTNGGNTITKENQEYFVNGKKVKDRVTNLAKRFYDQIFKDKKVDVDSYEQSVRDLKAEEGTLIHTFIERIFGDYIDNNGRLRTQALDSTTYLQSLSPRNNLIYRQLEANFKERVASFPEGTRFLSEVMIYDPAKDRAGTIDFLAISPKGKVSILDWKSINLNVKKHSDIPGYKQQAWKIQIGEYKRMLTDAYNVPKGDFAQTQAIPIQTTFTPGNPTTGVLPQLTRITIGKVKAKTETEDYLLPVALESQSSGDPRIDAILEKLYAMEKLIRNEKVKDGRKDLKAEQIRALQSAIRKLQVQQSAKYLIEQAKIFSKRVERTIKDYENLSKRDPKDVEDSVISDIADEFEDADFALDLYSKLNLYLADSVDPSELDDLNSISLMSGKQKILIEEAEKEFVEKYVAGKRGIDSLLTPERIVKGLKKQFVSLSSGATKAMATLWEIVSMVKQTTDFQVDAENKRLGVIEKAYKEWAKARGLSNKNMFDILISKDKHQLIDQYRAEFYKEADEAIATQNTEWFKDNIDLDAYSEWANAFVEEKKAQIENEVYLGTEAEVAKKKQERITLLEEQYSEKNMLFNKEVKRFPLPSNHSAEYNELLKNKPALDFYNYIKERNSTFREIGYISARGSRTFLPYVQAGLVERLVTGGDLALGEDFFKSISVDAGEVGYGYVNPLTGKIEDKLPRYFTQEIANPSKDLFRIMSLTNSMAIRYNNLDEVEGQVRALNRVEKNKRSIITSDFGIAVLGQDEQNKFSESNEENSRLLEEMTKAVFYGQKYINTEAFDQTLGKIGGFGKSINDKLGMKLLPENMGDRKISATKSIDTMNRLFQQKVLGINVLSSISNFLGGSFQAAINAGRFFSRNDFQKSEMEFISHKLLQSEEGKKMGLALKYFIPFTDNVANEQAKKFSISPLSKHSPSDVLMSLMRMSDTAVQGSIFFSMLRNTIIVDGKLVNAREYLRSQPEFKERYKLSPTERKQLENGFNKKVQDLVEKQGLIKLARIENDELVIDGVDKMDESVLKFRRLTQSISKDALGNMTEDDARRINLTVIGRSMMMFKNWIPRLTEVRFGEMKYNNALDSYEWGRISMALSFAGTEWLKSISNLTNAIKANEKGLVFLNKMYDRARIDYEKKNGRGTFKMTKSEFFDMVRQNLKSNLRDAVFMTTLLAMFFAAKAFTPDDDDEHIKSYHKFMVRSLDKVSDELSFFYTPQGWESILNGSIFPSIGLLTDIGRIFSSFTKEMYGMATNNDELVAKTYPTKYTMKALPVLKEFANYIAVLAPDVAKEYGIKQPSEGRR